MNQAIKTLTIIEAGMVIIAMLLGLFVTVTRMGFYDGIAFLVLFEWLMQGGCILAVVCIGLIAFDKSAPRLKTYGPNIAVAIATLTIAAGFYIHRASQ